MQTTLKKQTGALEQVFGSVNPRGMNGRKIKRFSIPVLVSASLLVGCATPPEPPPPKATAVRLADRIVALARQEWRYFGYQTIRYDAGGESIAPVGYWEDEEPQSARVQAYWAAAGKPEWTGKDCEYPWSAAFVAWIMQQAGIPADQFQPAIAHWLYLSEILRRQAEFGRYFEVRALHAYAPRPGDLVCATRADTYIPATDTLPAADALRHAKLHCNIVVDREDDVIWAIGGNVRNAVSRVAIPIDDDGRVLPAPGHAWFLIVANTGP